MALIFLLDRLANVEGRMSCAGFFSAQSNSSLSAFPDSFAPDVSAAFSSPSFGSRVKTSTHKGSFVFRFLSTYLSACELCVSKSNISLRNILDSCMHIVREVGACMGAENSPERLAVPIADYGYCDARDETEAWQSEGEICGAL